MKSEFRIPNSERNPKTEILSWMTRTKGQITAEYTEYAEKLRRDAVFFSVYSVYSAV